MQWNGVRPNPDRPAPLRSLMEILQEKAEPYVTRYGENYLQGSGPLFNSIVRSGVEMTPGAGDLLGIEDLQTAAQNNDWGGIGLGLLAAIPGIPSLRGVRGEARAARQAVGAATDAVPAPRIDHADSEAALARYLAANPEDTGARVLNPGDAGYPTNAQWDEASQAYVAPVETPAPQIAPRPERVPSLRPAMKGTDGKIYTADDNHFTAMASMPEDARRRVGLNDSYRGFVDDRGRYLNRARAQEYALNFGLLRDDAPSWARNNHELVSEYLRPYEPPAPIAPVEPDYPIRAYHGSPHSFDRFSLDKIGTGEGAQAYGHGLYFAESEDVARSYRDALATGPMYDGLPAQGATWAPTQADRLALKHVADRMGPGVPPEQAIQDALTNLDESVAAFQRGDPDALATAERRAGVKLANFEEIASRVRALDPAKFSHETGSMYEVGINAHPDTFLDWDRPLSEQPAIAERLGWTPDAMEAYRASTRSDDDALLAALTGDADYTPSRAPVPDGLPPLSRTGAEVLGGNQLFGQADDPAKSARLRELGINGVRYRDGFSRGRDGEGSSNYVVFNDELVKILRKYGVSGLGFGVGGTALADELDRRGQAQEF